MLVRLLRYRFRWFDRWFLKHFDREHPGLQSLSKGTKIRFIQEARRFWRGREAWTSVAGIIATVYIGIPILLWVSARLVKVVWKRPHRTLSIEDDLRMLLIGLVTVGVWVLVTLPLIRRSSRAPMRRRLSTERCARCRYEIADVPERDGWVVCPECGLDVPGEGFEGQPSPIDGGRAVG